MYQINAKFLLFFLIAAIFSLAPAQAQPVDAGYARAELVTNKAEIAPGESFYGALKLDIYPGWHVYWINPGDSGLPPTIEWLDDSDAQIDVFSWPVPHEQAFAGLMNYGYEGRLVLPFQITAPSLVNSKGLNLLAKADWLICKDVCIPETANLSLYIPYGSSRPNAIGTDLILEGLDKIPQAFTGEAFIDRSDEVWRLELRPDMAKAEFSLSNISKLRFFPYDHQILHNAKQNLYPDKQNLVLELLPDIGFAKKGDLSGVIVVSLKDGSEKGFDITASPGQVDVKPDRLEQSMETANAGGYSFSFIATLTFIGLAFLGGLILNLMPCVLPVLSIKAYGLIHSAQQNRAESRLHAMLYFSGVLVCFIAIALTLLVLRSAGEQVGLGFQLQYPPVTAGLALLVFLIGLNMFGVFEFGTNLIGIGSEKTQGGGASGAFFTGLLAAFVGAPCVGPFLGAALGATLGQSALMVIAVFTVMGVGMALPFTLLGFIPTLGQALPKPGAWMRHLREFLAFLMIFTAIWLLWILAGQTANDTIIVLLLGADLMGFGLWFINALTGKKRLDSQLGRLLAVACIFLGFVWPIYHTTRPVYSQTAIQSTQSNQAWSPERVEQLRAEGKPVFVDFTARWCVTCQANKQTTLRNQAVLDSFDRHGVIFLEADWTNRNAVIARELARYGRAGIPLYLFYVPGQNTPIILPEILTPALVINTIESELPDFS